MRNFRFALSVGLVFCFLCSCSNADDPDKAFARIEKKGGQIISQYPTPVYLLGSTVYEDLSYNKNTQTRVLFNLDTRFDILESRAVINYDDSSSLDNAISIIDSTIVHNIQFSDIIKKHSLILSNGSLSSQYNKGDTTKLLIFTTLGNKIPGRGYSPYIFEYFLNKPGKIWRRTYSGNNRVGINTGEICHFILPCIVNYKSNPLLPFNALVLFDENGQCIDRAKYIERPPIMGYNEANPGRITELDPFSKNGIDKLLLEYYNYLIKEKERERQLKAEAEERERQLKAEAEERERQLKAEARERKRQAELNAIIRQAVPFEKIYKLYDSNGVRARKEYPEGRTMYIKVEIEKLMRAYQGGYKYHLYADFDWKEKYLAVYTNDDAFVGLDYPCTVIFKAFFDNLHDGDLFSDDVIYRFTDATLVTAVNDRDASSYYDDDYDSDCW